MIETSSSGDEYETQLDRKQRVGWFQRPTIRTLKGRAEIEAAEFNLSPDRRDNDETRLPPTESVHLGGVVLAESFTPSTISELNRAVKNLPVKQSVREKLLADIARSRRSGSTNLRNISLFRPGVGFVDSESYRDPELPEGVDAVWLQFNCTIPSVTTVVATFTLSEEAGDLSTLMRKDYTSGVYDVKIRVFGRAARLRQRIPWARPRMHGPTFRVTMAASEKSRACAEAIRYKQEECERWFFQRFRGRFSLASSEYRPIINLLLTAEQAPFAKESKWLQPLGLEHRFDLWRSGDTHLPGWFLSLSRRPHPEGRLTIVLAARRKDVDKGRLGGDGEPTNWRLTQRVGAFQAPLAAKYALVALLTIYSNELRSLRDRAGVKKRPQRTISEAKALDRYLINDGLDAATITSDIGKLANDYKLFSWGVPQYVEFLENDLPSNANQVPVADGLLIKVRQKYNSIKDKIRHGDRPEKLSGPQSFTEVLCEELKRQSTHLADDTAATTGNIRASAELRQAITNTRLQRTVLVLSVIAIIVAIAVAT